MALDKIKTDVITDANVTIEKLASDTGVKSDRHSIPARTTTQRDAMSSPQPGDIIYNSTIGNGTVKFNNYNGSKFTTI